MFHPILNKLFYLPENQTMQIPIREDIEEKYKWNLKDIYDSDEKWEDDFSWVEKNINKYHKFEGTLSSSAENLLACLKFDEEVGIKLERLYLYSMLSKDSDMRAAKYQGMDDRIKTVYSKVLAASSYIKPELLNVDEKKLLLMINSHPDLGIYRHSIRRSFKI